MDSLERECACPTVRLDAGDQMQGTLASNLVHGRSSVEALSTLGLSVWMLAAFRTGHAGYQFVSTHSWSADLGIRWTVGIDGISLFMVVLNAVLTPIALLASARVDERVKAFTVWILVLEAALMGAFLSLDLVLFFVFFELSLVPMYFLIAGWGHGRRRYAAMKFFIYTMAGSAFLLVGILTVAFLHQSSTGVLTFDIRIMQAWAPAGLAPSTAAWLFAAFTIAFAVKVPLFPLHTWLPDAHTEAPTAGSVILAGLMLKLGTYGFLRFGLYLFPEASTYFAPLLITLGTIGIITAPQSGIVPHTTAITPEPMCTDASATKPLPTTKKSSATIAACIHVWSGGTRSPRRRAMPIITTASVIGIPSRRSNPTAGCVAWAIASCALRLFSGFCSRPCCFYRW